MTAYKRTRAYTQKEPGGTLWGWREIAVYLRVSEYQAWKWSNEQGLPVAKMPDGRRMTSKSLLDAWILARAEALQASKAA